MKRAYLSLGSNIGPRISNIRKAVELLGDSGVHVARLSSFYRTEPVDFRPQPWFVNCVAEVETELMPLQLLHRLQAIERKLGRRPGIPKGPRPLDIDILLFENLVMRSPVLVIPHERLHERRFVLIPLREIAPGLRHPVTRLTAIEMLANLQDQSLVVKLKPEEVMKEEGHSILKQVDEADRKIT